MTTLVAVNTRDALVMGCDTLGTSTRRLVDINKLFPFFDDKAGWGIKVDADNKPLLDFSGVWDNSEEVPYYHVTHVDKLFPLDLFNMGVMTSGLASLGDRSIKSLVTEFRDSPEATGLSMTPLTVETVGKLLLDFFWKRYEPVYPDERNRQALELMLCGYGRERQTPGVSRIHVHSNTVDPTLYEFTAYFGAQMAEIQRLVNGTDSDNQGRIILKHRQLMDEYRNRISKHLEAKGVTEPVPKYSDFGDALDMVRNWPVVGLSCDFPSFSEQNAIEYVDFLVSIMINAHRFSMRMPTVGGEVQVAVLQKRKPMKFISRREWRHEGNVVPREEA